ncbi:MAG: WxcM-like domain-containing protein [Patescibacteria group bacterium]
MLQLPNKIPSVGEVNLTASTGPWKSKSGGNLNVHFRLPLETLMDYLTYNEKELKEIPEDIRGIRVYSVRDMPKNGIGGNEFHRIRKEIFVVINGTLECVCEDLFSNISIFKLSNGMGVRIPPFIMHTFQALEENTGFLVMVNTLFNPDDPKTHDTYSRGVFEELKGLL